jgi:hypothetical protein
MKRRLAAIVLLPFIAATVRAEGLWNKKDNMQWNACERSKLLEDSPFF